MQLEGRLKDGASVMEKKGFLAGWICRGVAKQLVQLCCLLLLSSHPSRLGVNVSFCPCVPVSLHPRVPVPWPAQPSLAVPPLLSLLGKGLL